MTTETEARPATNVVRYGGDLVAIPNREWHLDIIDGPEYWSSGGNGKATKWRVVTAEISARWNHGKWTMDVKLEGASVLGSGKLGSARKYIYAYKTEADALADVTALRLALAEEYRPTTVIEITEGGESTINLASELADAKYGVLTKFLMSDEFRALGDEAATVLREYRKRFKAVK